MIDENVVYIEYDDLNEGMKMVADVLGIEAARKLIQAHSNETIYIPQVKSLLRNVIKKQIKTILSSGGSIDLTKYKQKFGCSYQFLRLIIREIYEENKVRNNRN